MNQKLLQEVYDAENFRKIGHQLMDDLADHLKDSLSGKSEKVIRYNAPEDEKAFWEYFLVNGETSQFFTEVLRHTTHVHHPNYIGHQVCAPAPLSALAGMVSALLNNGMAVYEMGMAPSAIERIITDLMAKKIGFGKEARGVLTSGGTLANLTALLAARKAMVPHDVWNEGTTEKLAVMVSEEAHYCVDRAAKIMGLGEQGIIKIPVTKDFRINLTLLEASLQTARNNGLRVFAMVGSAPSTATGIYDDLDALAAFCTKHHLWFHVDGAHGGAAVFSNKYNHTVKGIEKADSVVIDGHKMMLMSTITTALIFKNGAHSHATFSQKADYLLQQSTDEDWYNLAKRTFECTKTMMSLQWYLLLKTYGEEVFEANVTTLYDLGQAFAGHIQKQAELELATNPMSNIVCLRFWKAHLPDDELNRLNLKIRQELLEEGDFYIVQTRIQGKQYLRTTIMNPFTTISDLEKLSSTIVKKGNALVNA